MSYVRGCAFHHGFAPAIGVFGTDRVDIDDNIIHFTVGEGNIIIFWPKHTYLSETVLSVNS